ncbi:uncharacterized protein LOC127093769 [Lathyrus oleraceus]|uniref:uncharacterized protein LOC127093769 n=1 Tax=Pisum sativum TaxID=3888 RepID=UPI0021D02D60|nr:uncharacterized protein LOC127093769 [Pisum sativum]
MNLLKDARLIKIVSDIRLCYENIIKEFIVNLSPDCNIEGSQKYKKVYVRGKCVKFSPSIIDAYLERNKSGESGKVLSMDNISKEIIVGQVKQWLSKWLLYCGKLSVKYVVLNRIDHETCYSYVVKLPIALPFLITEIILKQHPNIVHVEEMKNKKPLPLTLNKKLIVGTHVPDIMVKHHGQTVVGISSPASKATRKNMLSELMEVSKALQETITPSTIKKRSVDGLIKILTKENDVEDEDKVVTE